MDSQNPTLYPILRFSYSHQGPKRYLRPERSHYPNIGFRIYTYRSHPHQRGYRKKSRVQPLEMLINLSNKRHHRLDRIGLLSQSARLPLASTKLPNTHRFHPHRKEPQFQANNRNPEKKRARSTYHPRLYPVRSPNPLQGMPR